jgi:hypothetical protein
MKERKDVCVALLAASLFFAGRLIAQPPEAQQTGEQARTDSNAAQSDTKSKKTGAAAETSKRPVNSSATTLAGNPPSPKAAANPTAAQQSRPANSGGVVWVNTESRVYHKPGSRYYGKTKQGKYMTEADAIKAGYHAAKKE